MLRPRIQFLGVAVMVCVGIGPVPDPTTTRHASLVHQRLQILRGDDEVSSERVRREIRDERAQYIETLAAVVGDPRAGRKRIAGALHALGSLRAIEAFDLLVSRIAFCAFEEHPYNRPFTSPTEWYPAVGALMCLGPAVQPALLEAVAVGRVPEGGIKQVGFIIANALGREAGRKRILDFASGRPEEQRKRLLAREMMMYYD